jgi:type II secretory pathway component GspD/PulD (secretin)
MCLIGNFSYAADLPTKLPIPTTLPLGLPPIELTHLDSPKPAPNDFNLNFNNISISNLSTAIFTEILQKNFVLSPKVIQDERVVSFRYNRKSGNLESYLVSFYKDLGYTLSLRNGTYYLDSEVEKKAEDFSYSVYVPRYRTANYLADIVRPFFPDSFLASNKSISTDKRISSDLTASPTSALGMIDKTQEVLTFKYENEKSKNKILDILKQADTQESNLVAITHVYEVTYTDQDGSAMGLMLNLANNKLKLNLGSTNSLQDFVSFSSSTLNLFLSSVNTNNNIRMISNPVLRIKNGKESKFIVGSSVPTLGNVTLTSGGASQQSVNYVDTGLTFKITPTITKDSISIDLQEEISDAVKTETGVNNSPTLTKRNLSSSFTLKKNEVVMLSALTQDKNTKTTSRPFLFPFFDQKIDSKSKTDIVIFFEVIEPSPIQNESVGSED